MFYNTLKSLLDPAVAFSGFAVLILSGISKIKNPIKMFRLTSIEEMSFMSRESRLFRIVLIRLFLCLLSLLYTVYLLSLDISGNYLYNIISNLNFFIYLIVFLFSLMYLILLSIPYIQKKVRRLIINNKSSNRNHIFFLLFTLINMLIYLLCILTFFAAAIISYLETRAMIETQTTKVEGFDFLLNGTLYTPPTIILLLLMVLFNTLFLLFLPVVSKYLGHSESVIHITLKNGVIISNKYMFNSNFRDGVIISDSNNSLSKKSYIRNENILKIDFSTINYILGEEDSPRNKLVKNLKDLNEIEIPIVNDILQRTIKH